MKDFYPGLTLGFAPRWAGDANAYQIIALSAPAIWCLHNKYAAGK